MPSSSTPKRASQFRYFNPVTQRFQSTPTNPDTIQTPLPPQSRPTFHDYHLDTKSIVLYIPATHGSQYRLLELAAKEIPSANRVLRPKEGCCLHRHAGACSMQRGGVDVKALRVELGTLGLGLGKGKRKAGAHEKEPTAKRPCLLVQDESIHPFTAFDRD